MRKIFMALIVSLTIVMAGSAQAESFRGSRADAVAMVQKAVQFMRQYGNEETYAEANNPHGQFIRGDLYIAITGLDGYAFANGGSRHLVGRNLIDIRDANGKYIQRERIEIAQTRGKGWQDYKWVNPLNGQLETKSMYFETVGDVVIACGVYSDGAPQVAAIAGL